MLALQMDLDVVAIASSVVAEVTWVARDPPTELVIVIHLWRTEVHQVCIQVLSDKGEASQARQKIKPHQCLLVDHRKQLSHNRLACVELGGPGSSTDDGTGHTDICPSQGHGFRPGGAACCTSSLRCSYTTHTGILQRPALRHVSARRLTNEQDSGWDLKEKHIQQNTDAVSQYGLSLSDNLFPLMKAFSDKKLI